MQNRYLNRALTTNANEREERSKLLRQAHEAIKILPTEKLKENVSKLQNDAGIKFR